MRILKYILLIPALALAAACNDRPGPEPGGDNLLRIKTGTHAMTATTKAPTVSLGVDNIYAYPFNLSSGTLNGIVITPTSMSGSEYTYSMPEPSQDIIFTNVTDGDGGYEVVTAQESGFMTVSLPDGSSGADADLVAGTLSKEEVDPETGSETVYPVHLDRMVAQITINFRVKKNGGEELISDLSEFFSEVSISVPTYSTLNMPALDTTAWNYSGKINSTWKSSSVPQAQTLQLADGRFIFPSCDEGNPIFTLRAVSPTGETLELNSQLGFPIDTNDHYTLTMTLRQKSESFSFEVEDFVRDTMDVNLDFTDVVVVPTMDVDMSTRSGYSNPIFRIGEDDLYCYPFLGAEGDSLAPGYPQRQTAIVGGRYHFKMPADTNLRLMISNVDLTDPASGYGVKVGENTAPSPLIYSDSTYVYFVNGEGWARTPYIIRSSEGHYFNDGQVSEINLTLYHRSTSARLLLNITGCDTLPVLTDLVQYVWIEYPSSYQERVMVVAGTDNDDNYRTPVTIETDAIPASGIPQVTYYEDTYYELDGVRHMFSRSTSSTFYISVLTTSGATRKFSFSNSSGSYDYWDNNTVIFNIPLSSLQ